MAGQPIKRARAAVLLAQMGAETATEKPKRRAVRKTRNAAPADVVDTPRAAALPASEVAGLGEALAGMAAGADIETNKAFEALRVECFAFAREVMAMPLDPALPTFSKLLGVKEGIAKAVLTATARIRPGDLRERDDDGVGALLDRIKNADTLDARAPTADDLLN